MTTEMTNEASETTTTAQEPTKPTLMAEEGPAPFGCYALIAHKETGEVKTLYAKTKTKMGNQLTAYGEMWALLGIFRGKQLSVAKKISFSFN